MNFKSLLEQYSFEDIFPDFMKLWRINVPESAELLDNDGWKKIYHGIQSLNAKPSDYYILLVCRWERCSPMIDMNCSVYSKPDYQLVCSIAEYPSWEEIIGMEIVIDEDVSITYKELTAGLLWEITYYGGTEEMSNEKQKQRVNGTEINVDNISFCLLFLNLAYWHPYICLYIII